MKKRKNKLNQIADTLEALITIILLIGVVVFLIEIVFQYFFRIPYLVNFEYSELLEQMLNLIIGIEFARMLCIHSTNSILDVLLLTMARYIIIDHSSVVVTATGIASIAILFIIRKQCVLKVEHQSTAEYQEKLTDNKKEIDETKESDSLLIKPVSASETMNEFV